MSGKIVWDVKGVTWFINKYPDGWRWESNDHKGGKKESKKPFDTKEECITDAKVNGMGEENLVAKLGRGHKIEKE